MDPRTAIQRLLTQTTLSESEAQSLFGSILEGQADPAQIGAILSLLQQRGPTIDEIVGAARAMRAHVEPVPINPQDTPKGSVILDTCGTGGAAKTFNVSTAAALVVAAAAPGRLLVAKHGNRSRTGRGSAEVLESLGVNVNADHATQARCLLNAGICFCFAIHHHPAMRHAAAPRASLGVPTIFNILGPLTNPARATHQLIGVYRPDLIDPVAQSLARLGSVRAMVVHSDDGLDEISPAARSTIAIVQHGRVESHTIDPRELGIHHGSIDALKAADRESAVAMLKDVLGAALGAPRDAVLLNAGAALWVASVASDLAEGIARAAEAIDSGSARATLANLITESHRA